MCLYFCALPVQVALLANVLQWFTYFCLIISVLNANVPTGSRVIDKNLIDNVMTFGMAATTAAAGVVLGLTLRNTMRDLQEEHGEKVDQFMIKAKVKGSNGQQKLSILLLPAA